MSPINRGELRKPKGIRAGKAVSCDPLISSVMSLMAGKAIEKRTELLKVSHGGAERTRKAARPSAAPAVAVAGLSIACALLGVECLQPQPRPVLLKTFSFPSIIPRSSLLADSQAKADIFTARRKLYVSTTILEGRERESPYSVTTTNHSDLLKMTKWEANCPKEKDS